MDIDADTLELSVDYKDVDLLYRTFRRYQLVIEPAIH
jgi:hypothetical protein